MPTCARASQMAGVLLFVLVFAAGSRAAEPPRVEPEDAIRFVDEAVWVAPPVAAAVDATCSVRVLTRAGWSEPVVAVAAAVAGRWRLRPLREGLHAVVVRPAGAEPFEVRFLAMDPPGAIDRAALAAALPLSHDRLFGARGPYRVVALGDSVTATGDYPVMLAKMLRRATGNAAIEVASFAHPGKSIDATVRHWDEEAGAAAPDLGLVMYGLNDQSGGATLGVYLAQHAWVAARLREGGADPVFLQPTPHLAVLDGAADPRTTLRTLRFAAGLADPESLDRTPAVPVVPTFDAVWGPGGPDLPAAIRRLWPLYPRHYSRHFTTILDAGGAGDRIHPNALGHLAIAKAVFERLTRTPSETPPRVPTLFGGELLLTGTTAWEGGGVVSRVRLANPGERQRTGRIEAVGPTDAGFDGPAQAYDLPPGGTLEWEVAWPGVRRAEDLLAYPNERYLAEAVPRIDLLATEGGRSSAASPPLPWTHGAAFHPLNANAAGRRVAVAWGRGAETHATGLELPDAETGRVPLTIEAAPGQWIARELFFTRFAGAAAGEAAVDGDLAEWGGALWQPVGLPVQARGTRGPADRRAAIADCDPSFALKAGADHLHLAMKVEGPIDGDRLTVWFDPREPDELGGVGGYFWLDAEMAPGDAVKLRPGDTTRLPAGVSVSAARRSTTDGESSLEVAIPYALFDRSAFPASGDLGLSLAWTHKDADRGTTVLQWCDRGHPWTPLGFGVVRLQPEPDRDALPFRVRIR